MTYKDSILHDSAESKMRVWKDLQPETDYFKKFKDELAKNGRIGVSTLRRTKETAVLLRRQEIGDRFVVTNITRLSECPLHIAATKHT